MSAPVQKIVKLRAHMAAEDWVAALAMAARFPRLGAEKAAIERGHEACVRPDFQRQLGRDPAALKAQGIAALIRRYGGERA